MKIDPKIMAKVVEIENYQRCLDARICPECGSKLDIQTVKSGTWYLECRVASCNFNKEKRSEL